MFLIRWLGRLISLPVTLLGRIAAMLSPQAGEQLLRAAWQLGGDGNVGVAVAQMIYRRLGLEAARAQVKLWLQRRPRPELAAWAGLMADMAGDFDDAAGCLALGRQFGGDRAGNVDLLEYALAVRQAGPVGSVQIARRYEDRRDLNPLLSKSIRIELMFDALLGRRFDEAAARARHLLAVADDSEAEMVLWAMALHQADQVAAGRHLARVRLERPQVEYLRALGLHAIGRADEAAKALAELGELNPRLAATAEALIGAQETAI